MTATSLPTGTGNNIITIEFFFTRFSFMMFIIFVIKFIYGVYLNNVANL